MSKLSDIDVSPKGQQEAINELGGKNEQPNEQWFVIEKGDGWEVSFGSPNSKNGCILEGPDAKKYAYLIVSLNNSQQQPTAGEYETRTIENTYICPCGNIFVEDDDYDTLGSESGVLCPNCGNEKFQTIKSRLDRAEAINKDLLEALEKYGRHGVVGGDICEKSKHSDYNCTCGFEAAKAKKGIKWDGPTPSP